MPSIRSLAPAASAALLLTALLGAGCASEEADLHEAPAETTAEVPAQAAQDEPMDEPSNEDADPDAWQRNRIAWTTASEVDNFGYDIYRGDSEEGPFERVTEQPIAGGGTTDEPSAYEYYDESIEMGTVYWYYVESISLDGARERFTPIFPSKPKYPPGEEPTAPQRIDEGTD